MIRGSELRNLIESNGQRDPVRAVRHLLEGFGLIDVNGREVTTPAGNPDWAHVLETRAGKNPNFEGRGYMPSEVHLREMAEAFCGEHWHRKMQQHAAVLNRAELLGMEGNVAHLYEAGAGAVVPGDFINVSALTAAVTGLYEVAMLEGFNRPDLTFADRLAPDEPTRTFGGKKIIGAGPIADNAEQRLPGNPTKRAGLAEKWMMTPETQETALGIEVLYETIYLDLTGDVTTQANDVGYRVKRRKATRITDCFIGSTNYTYNFKGSTYATYIAAGYYDNDFSNELVHENQVENVLIKFRDMTDPITGERVMVTPNIVVLDLAKERTANAIFGSAAQSFQYRDDPAGGSAQLINVSTPAYKGRYEIIHSPLIHERLLAAVADGGLALSAANAAKYWWMLDSTNAGGAFRYSQNWPFRVQQATPTQMDMIDRGIAMFIKADERGEPYAKQPRNVVRSKN